MELPPGDECVLLFSGGVDSTALLALIRPAIALCVDYGQRPAAAEARAARAIALRYGVRSRFVTLGISDFGSGILHDDSSKLSKAPSPEWWPFRNQFLATAAAAVALQEGLGRVVVGSVKGDGDRHADGTDAFYESLSRLMRLQEGSISVTAPATAVATEELVRVAHLSEDALAATTSCHRSNRPCGQCPGCWKRQRVFASLAVPGYRWLEDPQ